MDLGHQLKRHAMRLWQPHRMLFWLVLAFNGLSSVLAWTLHLADPPGVWRVVLTVLAVSNAVMGWWLLLRLWNDAPVSVPGGVAQDRPDHQQTQEPRQHGQHHAAGDEGAP
jgi:hypothetical protein